MDQGKQDPTRHVVLGTIENTAGEDIPILYGQSVISDSTGPAAVGFGSFQRADASGSYGGAIDKLTENSKVRFALNSGFAEALPGETLHYQVIPFAVAPSGSSQC